MKKIYDELVQEHGTNNPFTIAKNLGIIVLESELNENKGIYHTITIEDKTYDCIHINNNLSRFEKYYTMAHELAHCLLHQGNNLHFLRRVSNLPLSRKEKEVDLFASYFIISDEEIEEINNLSYISTHYKLDYAICEKRASYILDS